MRALFAGVGVLANKQRFTGSHAPAANGVFRHIKVELHEA